MEASLDVCIAKCPSCGKHYAEASWYALTLESDLECGKCGAKFNAEEHSTDEALVRFELSDDGKVKSLKLMQRR